MTLTKYVNTMGSYMQHVRIICPSPNLLTASSVAKCVKTVLNGLSNLQKGKSTIQSFDMCQLYFEETWNSFRSSKSSLVDSVSAFVEYQTNLKLFRMRHALLTPPFAYRIMKSFARSKSVRTLEVMDIVNYYSLEVSTRVMGCQLRATFQKCWKLREISLNYSYLSAIRLVDLCECLDSSLEKLVIHVPVSDYSRGWNILTADNWKLACQVCPRLKVSFHLENWPRDCTGLLVPHIPLVELSTIGGQCRYSSLTFGSKTSMLLDHLAMLYPDTLQSATFVAESIIFSPPRKNSLVDFLVKCQSIKTLFFSNRLMTQELINELREELQDTTIKDIDVVKIL